MKTLNRERFYNRANRMFAFSWLLLLFGITVTVLVSHRVKVDTEHYAEQNFTTRCAEIRAKIEARLAVHKQMLLSGAALFDSSTDVSREEWRIYVKRLSLSRNLDGVQALGFSLWILPTQLKAHENSIRKEGFADYQVKPVGEREVYTSIIYIEPFRDRNLRAFGYDMYSESVRREAMNYARDNNDIGLSGKVTLLQEDTINVQAGTLMYAPVYQKTKPIDTIQQRHEAIFGWVYSPFRMDDLLRNIVSASNALNNTNLHLTVYDGEQIHVENLLYESENMPSNAPLLFNFETSLSLYGRIWTLQFEQFATAEEKVNYDKVWFSAAGGTVISFLLFFLLRSFITTKQQAKKIAIELTDKWHESEQRFQSLADSAPVMIWASGTDKLCHYFNKVWLDFSGKTLAELKGNGWATDVHVDDLAHCLTIYGEAFDAHEPFRMEYRLKRYDGKYRWILDTGEPRFSGDMFIGYIGSCLDITERHEMERDLIESEKKLAVINKDLLQFTNIAAHHLQEPARRIVSFVERLQNELADTIIDSEEAEFTLRFIKQSALRQRALVRDIQLYLASTQARAATERVDVESIIAKVLDKNAAMIRDAHAVIECGDLPTVMIDRPRLYDIFSILIENALYYRRLDCIPKIRIYGKLKAEHICYYVEDNGIGIPEEYRERVFLVFERLSVNDDQNSTGIGLAIVRRIIESCNGSVSLKKSLEGGTTVVLNFPVVR